MNNSPEIAGAGIGILIAVVLFYTVAIALTLWIGYLIVRTAVKNGILRADAHRASLARTPATGGPPAPAGWYATSAGKRYWDGQEWSTPPSRP